MRSFVALAAFAAGTNALVGRSDSCCFHLTASGGVSGSLGQLSDGQVRIGDNSLSAAQFCIANGAITDSEGRGCVITSETTQFQCDQGATATSGFSVTSSGELEFQGSPNFIACETGQNGGRNVYTTNSTSVTQCQSVELTADSCSSSSSGSGAGSSSSTMASTAPASSEVASGTPVATPSSAASSPIASSPVAPSPVASSPVASSPVPSSEAPGPAPSSEAPSAPVPGGPESSAPVPASSGSPGPGTGSSASAPAPANSAPLSASPITVMTTVTITDCSCESTGAPAPGVSSQPSVAPSGGAIPTGGAQPSGPAGGSQPSGSSAPVAHSSAATSPAGGTQPSSSVVIPSFSTAPVSSASVPASSTASTSGSCPTTLSGNYEYPHLIVPVNSSSSDTAYGTQYFGTVSSTVSTAFNFDIPSSDSGKTCSLVFLFPKKADLETSDYTFSGDGKIDFAKLSSAVSQSTTYDNLPSVSQDLGEITISEGNSYVVSTFSCPAGETVAYEMKSAGSTYLNFFEDYNPSPLGLYITVC